MAISEEFRRRGALDEAARRQRNQNRVQLSIEVAEAVAAYLTANPPAAPKPVAFPGAVLDLKTVSVGGVLLAVGSKIDVPVTWNRDLGRTDYGVHVMPGDALLGKATFAIRSDASKTASGCVLSVTAQQLIAVGVLGAVHCLAVTP